MALLVLILFWRDESGEPASAAALTADRGSASNASAGPNWGMLIGAYALAKVFEAADAQIWELTLRTLSGHSLKHVAAACVAIAVIAPMVRRVGVDR